jgi:hypothetical protein
MGVSDKAPIGQPTNIKRSGGGSWLGAKATGSDQPGFLLPHSLLHEEWGILTPSSPPCGGSPLPMEGCIVESSSHRVGSMRILAAGLKLHPVSSSFLV